MPTIHRGIYAGEHVEELTPEEVAAIRRENCKTHGQQQEDAAAEHSMRIRACAIVGGIFVAIYLAMLIIEKVVLGL